MNLVRPFSKEEVRVTIIGLNQEGSLEPNDILGFVNRNFWDLVRPDVIATFEEFYKVNYSMEIINKSPLPPPKIPRREYS